MKKRNKTNIELYVINKVKEQRVSFDYSQAELADLLNLSAGFIGKVESGNYTAKYNINHINSLSRIFNCSPKDFFPLTYIK
ncbi:MAG: transcriptional regulator [Ignavibacteria bacterium GWB2_35_12]|nr:MAG: transcriptional regulator [Ignavibacteria bacterium GWA2_35_8]OGU37994.1 MAG: transcriptional regulator [Ignavibacteria bacterium GWB2_35_12]OGU95680.1 MAG: transcriptional regulator [Ignavibacteria bacterium RIFOXYA2_FULL_35_10]OGV25085.1 MAG: transcriptional regulator [Ignavibacteria bacterium RIFOXYC2_FULL_35_21]